MLFIFLSINSLHYSGQLMTVLVPISPKSSTEKNRWRTSERRFWENMSAEITVWASGWNAEDVSDPTGFGATAQSCVSYTRHNSWRCPSLPGNRRSVQLLQQISNRWQYIVWGKGYLLLIHTIRLGIDEPLEELIMVSPGERACNPLSCLVCRSRI